jgi:hypothetical protein
MFAKATPSCVCINGNQSSKHIQEACCEIKNENPEKKIGVPAISHHPCDYLGDHMRFA